MVVWGVVLVVVGGFLVDVLSLVLLLVVAGKVLACVGFVVVVAASSWEDGSVVGVVVDGLTGAKVLVPSFGDGVDA